VLELLKLLDLLRRVQYIHSKAQDLSETDVIINHFAELNFGKVTFIQSKLGNTQHIKLSEFVNLKLQIIIIL
jgi:hypothetical protein